MSKLTFFIAIALVVSGASAFYPFEQLITAQNQNSNTTDNQTANQTAGLNLLPPSVIKEEVREEIFGGQQ